MEGLEDLELEDMEALGLRIEKCVEEVLRSHLVERSLNTTKNYVSKQKKWKINQAPHLQPFTNVHHLNHRPSVRRSAFVLATLLPSVRLSRRGQATTLPHRAGREPRSSYGLSPRRGEEEEGSRRGRRGQRDRRHHRHRRNRYWRQQEEEEET
jgi:hypothetical protein